MSPYIILKLLLWEGRFGEIGKQTISFPFLDLWANFTMDPSFKKVIYREAELCIQKGRLYGLKD